MDGRDGDPIVGLDFTAVPAGESERVGRILDDEEGFHLVGRAWVHVTYAANPQIFPMGTAVWLP